MTKTFDTSTLEGLKAAERDGKDCEDEMTREQVTVTPTYRLRLAWRGMKTELVPVSFADVASKIFSQVRDANGFGASDMKPGCGDLLDVQGKIIGRISYNGRIWQAAHNCLNR